MTVAEYMAAAGLVLNVLVAVVGLTWGIAKIKETVGDEIEEHRKIFDGELNVVRREFGETGAALRTKINEIEIWTRDNFVKNQAFFDALNRISGEVREFSERIDKRLERMEAKIDNNR